jgi:signal transduction histidine kinase
VSDATPVTATVDHLAARLADQHTALAAQWLARLDEVLDVDVRQVFPTHTLLDHIPELILQIAGYLVAPQEQEIAANTAVLAKASELGLLRYDQRASVHQLLREYQILGETLEAFFAREAEALGADADAAAAVTAVARANQAVRVLQQHTVDAFIARYTAAIERQTARLRSFSHLVSHEIRQPLQVLQGLARVLPRLTEDPEVAPIIGSLERNVERLADVAGKLERLARLTRTSEVALNEQTVNLASLAADVVRQLGDMADARGVRFEIADTLPTLLVDSGRAELVTMNLLANAVKYSDPDKADRVVRVHPDPSVPHPRVVVSDNGLGIPRSKLDAIFEQFVRVHAHLDDELGAQGLGLGLSIVRESMEAMGGTVSVSSQEGVGTSFVLDWPPTALVQPRQAV